MAPRIPDSRVNDLIRAETDITSIKKFLMAVAGIVFTSLLGIGIWVGTNDTKLSRLEKTVEDIEDRQRADDLLGVRLESKLAVIEAYVLEIRRSLKP